MTDSTNRRIAVAWALLLLFGLPLLLVLAKSPASPIGTVMTESVSLATLPDNL